MNRKEIEEIENKLNTDDVPEDKVLVGELKKIMHMANTMVRTLEERGYVVQFISANNPHSGTLEIGVKVAKEL